LRHLDRWTKQRREHAHRYDEALIGTGLITPRDGDDAPSVYHLYVIRVPGGGRDALQDHLNANGISTGIHYPIALPFLNAYRHLKHTPNDYPWSLKASGEILSLPMFAELTEEQIQHVAGTIATAPALVNIA
jgi:dTDP-4-amino-4,6-dideoxygalactose transaminase